MMPIQVMVVPVWVERLGWMLVHSLWQLAIVAILAAVLLRWLRNRSARSRYAVAVAMLAVMAVGPVVTWCLIFVEPVQRVSSSRTDERSTAVQQVASVVQKPVTTEAGSAGFEDTTSVEAMVIPLAAEAEHVKASAQTSEVSIDATSETSASVLLLDRKPASIVTLVRESIEKIARSIKPHLPILVGVWLLGVLICSIRPIWGLWIQWRLRHTGLQPVPESIQSALNVLLQKFRLTRAVRIAESALVNVPVVVGYLHPMILLPASVITGLTSSQLEAVLAHELAHVRRHDWLINTLQVIAETLLFYHPAVWWLSSRIRHERELCCDDIALGLDVDKAVFARTLLTLEELRQKAKIPAMAATGGDLAARVQRLLPTASMPAPSRSSLAAVPAIAVSGLLLLAIGLASRDANSVQVDSQQRNMQQEPGQSRIASPEPGNSTFNRTPTSVDMQSASNKQMIAGQVLDIDGKPAAHILVAYGTNWGTAFRTILTDHNGRYQIDVTKGMTVQSYRLFVIPDTAAAASRAITKEFGEQPVIRLQPGTRLNGRVLDAAGKGVPNVVVEAKGGDVIPTRYAITDSRGEYTTLPCQYGSYEITLLDGGEIPGTEETGARLTGGYLRIKDTISKTARTSQRIADFLPVESIDLEVQLQQSDGTPIPNERLFLSGSFEDQGWLQQFHEIEGRPGVYELVVPKGLSGRFLKLDERRTVDTRFLFGGPGAAIHSFERNEKVVLLRQAVSWVDLNVAVDGKPIAMSTELQKIAPNSSPGPFPAKDGGITYSIIPTGQPIESRFQNTDILGPMGRSDFQLSLRVAPNTQYTIQLNDKSGKEWHGTIFVAENERKTVLANLAAKSATPESGLPETGYEEKESVAASSKKVPVTDKDVLQSTEKPPTRTRSIEVLDENEQPVQNAQVQLQFVSGEDGVGYYVGETMTPATNAMGLVEIQVPEDAGSVSIKIVADGFNEFSERQAAAGSSSIRLKRGRSIHVRAVDVAGNLLAKAVPLLEGHRVVGREFVPQQDGSFKSPSVDLKRRLMRVVSAQENGPFLFSELADVEEAKPDADGVLELVLKPGARITGRLDDSVPRPISEGYVQLMVVEGQRHQLGVLIRDEYGEAKHENWVQPWTWEETASVQPDGTFAFESVPAGGVAQLHVVVDGHMSVNPSLETLLAKIQDSGATAEETAASLKNQIDHLDMWPTLIPLDKPSVDVLIKCQPTASCDFRILDPSGNPVSDAAVSFSPNGIFISGRMFLLGSYDSPSSTLVEALFHNAPMKTEISPGVTTHRPENKVRKRMRVWAERSFSRAKSDADGRVRIRNLPPGLRQRFSVWAPGFVLPKSQLYAPGNFPDRDRREAYVDLISGETIESTIYLDRDQPAVDREVLVMDDKGSPLSGITISLSEMRVGPKDWQRWSIQRFGAVQSAKSDLNGRVVLNVPRHVGNIPVERLRLTVNYEFDNVPRPVGAKDERFWVSGGLVDVPMKADDGIVAIIRNSDSSRGSKAVYGTLAEILTTQTPEQLLSAMIKTPNLAILRQLLTTAQTKQPDPVELLDEGRFRGESKEIRVRSVAVNDKSFSLVSAKVRPVDGTRQEDSEFKPLPECVFVFDANGQHVASLGGEIGTTGSGSAENVDILCLGPEEDWFVRVTRFQENGPFEYQSVYYRIGESVVPSLKYHHYANSNSWSRGPEKIIRHGDLNFEFPDVRSDYAGLTVGVTAEGVAVNGTIYWDGDKNQFFGASAQSVDGRPLYKVDTEWSKDFSALNPKADQMVLSGGIREFDHWYAWGTVVPAGHEAIVRVSIPQASGEPQIMEQKLAPGRHTLQLQAKPSDDGMTAKLQLRCGKEEEAQNAVLPFRLQQQQQSAAVVNILDAEKSVRLVERPLEGSEKRLTLEVKLAPLADSVK